MPRLIWVFAGRTLILLVLSWGGSYWYEVFRKARTIYTEHQRNVTTVSHTLNTGAHLNLSVQKMAVCSAFIFVVTVIWIGTTENDVRHTWKHDTLSLMNTRYFHWVLWELAKWWWFLYVLTSLALFDGIIETISKAFSRNIFQAYTGMFVFENNVFTFW